MVGTLQEEINDIETIRIMPVPAQQREAVLRRWITKNGGAATYRVLYDVLIELGERGAAERILDIARMIFFLIFCELPRASISNKWSLRILNCTICYKVIYN